MTPYEYACYKPYADQECKDTFRKYLEISETAELTWKKIAYAEKMERDGLIKTDAQVCYLLVLSPMYSRSCQIVHLCAKTQALFWQFRRGSFHESINN